MKAADRLYACLYRRAYRARHPEKEKAHHAAYYATHREEANAYRAAYRAAHLKEEKAKSAAYRAAHLQETKARNAAYRAAYQEEIKVQRALYSAAHPEMSQAANARRRARKRQAPINDFTAQQWREMQATYDHRCVYCGKRCKGKLAQEHLTPLIKGGGHTKINILPACKSCNSKKHIGPVLKPVQPLLL